MKQLFFFVLLMLQQSAGKANDSLFRHILVPKQAKVNPDGKLTLQLLVFDSTAGHFIADVQSGMLVQEWRIDGSVGVQASQTPVGRLDGLPNATAITYCAPRTPPKDNKVRVSCAFTENGIKEVLFADIEITGFDNAFCIDPMGIGIDGLGQEACVFLRREDYQPAAAARVPMLQNASTGMALYNRRCGHFFITVTEPRTNKIISIILPSLHSGVFVTAPNKCMLMLIDNKPACATVPTQAYVSQYCENDDNGNCTPVSIPAFIRIDSLGERGAMVSGYFTGQTGKVICGSDTPERHRVYGHFAVIRQPDIDAACDHSR